MSESHRSFGHSAPPTTVLPFQLVIGANAAAIGGIVAVLGDLRDQLDAGGFGIGIIVTSGFIASFLAQILLSPFADQGHGRTMAVIGTATSALALFLMAGAGSVTAWVVARALLGFAAGLLMPGLRRAAIVLDPEQSGVNLGRLVVGEIFGYMFGPVAAACLVTIGGTTTPFIAFGIAMLFFVPVVARLPPDRGRTTDRTRNPFGLLRARRLRGGLTLAAGYFAMIGAFESVLPVMLHDRGGTALHIGVTFTAFCIPVMLVSSHAGRLADRVPPVRIALTGMALSSASVLLYGYIPGLLPLVLVMVLAGFADGYGSVGGQIVVSRSVPEERQAGALGLMGAAQVLAAGLAAFPAAAAYEEFGERTTWLIVGATSLLVLTIGGLLIRGTDPVSEFKPATDRSTLHP